MTRLSARARPVSARLSFKLILRDVLARLALDNADAPPVEVSESDCALAMQLA